jgi:ribosomal protein L7/L12
MMQMADWTFWGAIISAFVAGWFFGRLMYKRPAPSQNDYIVMPSKSFSTPDATTAREIEKLSSLRNVGAITDNEYQSMKEKVVRESLTAAPSYSGSASPVSRPVVSGDWKAQVEAEIRANRKINAIKIYREATNLGLKEAKDAVEEIERSISMGLSPTFIESMPSENVPTVGSLIFGSDWQARVEAEIRADRKIEAIKIYREATGLGLKESKDAVEELERSIKPRF